ncbi:MAG: hypothetical protein WDN28_28635 [Chthoniobacter sp.]
MRDSALADVLKLIQENRDDAPAQFSLGNPPEHVSNSVTTLSVTPVSAMTAFNNEQAIKDHLKAHGAAELLNILKWENFPEKILLLGAWFEARGGNTPWRSSDMDDTFRQAKENAPRNFPRDIKTAIKSGWIHAETPRTYALTRSGWNRIGRAIEDLPQ